MKTASRIDLSTTQEVPVVELEKELARQELEALKGQLQQANRTIDGLVKSAGNVPSGSSDSESKRWFPTRHRFALGAAFTAIFFFNLMLDRFASPRNAASPRVTLSEQAESAERPFEDKRPEPQRLQKAEKNGADGWGDGWAKPKGLDPRTLRGSGK